MMTAKSFCYACAGIFLLVCAWTMGAHYARADFNPSNGYVIAYSNRMALTSDGQTWVLYGQDVPFWQQGNIPTPPVPVADILFWDRTSLITKDNVGWAWAAEEGSPEQRWYNVGQVPGGTVNVQGTEWSDVKKRFRDKKDN